MAYRDPYSDPYGQRPQYSNNTEFNPYAPTQQRHPSQDQTGPAFNNTNNSYPFQQQQQGSSYTAPAAPHRQATMRSFLTGDSVNTNPAFSKPEPPLPGTREKESGAANGFDVGEFSGNKEASFSKYRAAHQERIWTKGGRGQCVGRFFCCSLMTIVFLFLSIVGALALWIRPPAISIGTLGPPTDGTQEVVKTGGGIAVNLGVNIFVWNPNFFSVAFDKIQAQISYPLDGSNTPIGGGELDKIDFASHTAKNFTFPFQINYQVSEDPRGAILADLLSKCGLNGSKGDITVDYKITLGIRILFIPISPSISNSFTFLCPIDVSDLEGLSSGSGINIRDTSHLLEL